MRPDRHECRDGEFGDVIAGVGCTRCGASLHCPECDTLVTEIGRVLYCSGCDSETPTSRFPGHPDYDGPGEPNLNAPDWREVQWASGRID